MQKWFKQNLTIGIIITLLTAYGIGAAYAAVMKADIERLKTDTAELKNKLNIMPEDIARIKEQIIFIRQQNDRIENKLDKK